MASRGKKKTTMAKLNRETKLRERRQIKEARKEARERARLEPPVVGVAEDQPEGQEDFAPPAESVTTDS